MRAKDLEDFRPVALTSILAKCMERVVSYHLKPYISEQLDVLQFAYKSQRGTEDATLTLVDTIASHLQQAKAYVRVLFIDYTSAFNTMQIHLLLERLLVLGVNGGIVHWIKNFLTNRPQRVCARGFKSDIISLNTGAPQGCVLSPLLFSVYTSGIRVQHENYKLYKYADDMALVALLWKDCVHFEYEEQVLKLEKWCEESSLLINVSKTKELILNHSEPLTEIMLCDQTVEIVKTFKYLGIMIDCKLNFSDNVALICKKANQRLFLLRKLKEFCVSKAVLQRVYTGLIESVLGYNITVWFGRVTSANKVKLDRIIRVAGKIIGLKQKSVAQLYQIAVQRKALIITRDTTHPLNHVFELLPSRRRYRTPKATKAIYKQTFVPNAISLLNKR